MIFLQLSQNVMSLLVAKDMMNIGGAKLLLEVAINANLGRPNFLKFTNWLPLETHMLVSKKIIAEIQILKKLFGAIPQIQRKY